jgi:hypothetical protein
VSKGEKFTVSEIPGELKLVQKKLNYIPSRFLEKVEEKESIEDLQKLKKHENVSEEIKLEEGEFVEKFCDFLITPLARKRSSSG